MQDLIEKRLEVSLGIRIVASEYATKKTHGGLTDKLGIDEDNCSYSVERMKGLPFYPLSSVFRCLLRFTHHEHLEKRCTSD